jgi:hypothetical protein
LRQTCSPVYLAVPLSCRPTYITAGSSAFWARKFVQSVARPAFAMFELARSGGVQVDEHAAVVTGP